MPERLPAVMLTPEPLAEAERCSLLSTAIPVEQIGVRKMSGKMSAGQSSGTGATTEFDDEKVRKNDILSNRDKAQRLPGQSLDGKGVQVDEYKDCLLYTSDAADEEDSVDLGGRRIIKKKKT